MRVQKPFLAMSVATVMCAAALAQSASYSTQKADYESALNAALSANALDRADDAGRKLFELSRENDDAETAGRIAYTMASIAALNDSANEVPVWFDRCAEQYQQLGAPAQRVDCIHKAALSYRGLGRFGTAQSRLETAETVLADVGASRTSVAAMVFADLAESYTPLQFAVGARADADREKVLDYAKRAREIMQDQNQTETFFYAMLRAREAVALEDLNRFDEAVEALAEAVEIAAPHPEAADLLPDLRRRLAFLAAASANENSGNDTVSVAGAGEREIPLSVKQTRRISYPRSNRTAAQYGLVRTRITLDERGKVADIDILESIPEPAFGEATEKAVKHWVFTPEDGTPPEEVPPFEYAVSFDLVRTR